MTTTYQTLISILVICMQYMHFFLQNWKSNLLSNVFCSALKKTCWELSVAKLRFWMCLGHNTPERFGKLCMHARQAVYTLSQEPWGLEKYSSISGPIGQWSLTSASFNISVINKRRKQIPKFGWQPPPARMALLAQRTVTTPAHPHPTPFQTHKHRHVFSNTVKPVQHGIILTSVTSGVRVDVNYVEFIVLGPKLFLRSNVQVNLLISSPPVNPP